MSVKIFCNSCHRFVREAKKSEFSELTGNEICQDCEKTVATTLGDIEKTAKRAVVQIQNILSKSRADIEEMMRRVVRGPDGTDV